MYTTDQEATGKKTLPVLVENIPEELRVRPQWVVWKAVGEKPDKVPYSAKTGRKASSTDLMTWSTFEEVLGAYETSGYDGVGLYFQAATLTLVLTWIIAETPRQARSSAGPPR